MGHEIRIESVGDEHFSELTEIWEAAVRTTHHFLSESDIQYFKPLIKKKFLPLVNVFAAYTGTDMIVGFMGVLDGKIEMLFIRPEWYGCGVGRTLIAHALAKLNATDVDVNEQNEQAVGFYLRMGFYVESRSDKDGMGKPFPLLHMRHSSTR